MAAHLAAPFPGRLGSVGSIGRDRGLRAGTVAIAAGPNTDADTDTDTHTNCPRGSDSHRLTHSTPVAHVD